MKKIILCLVAFVFAISAARLAPAIASPDALAQAATAPPEQLVAGLNIAADDTNGPETRALFLINPKTSDVWSFPLTTVPGGPVLGQGMHVAIAPSRERIYVTMGGNADLPLRLDTFDVTWQAGEPTVVVESQRELVAAGTENVFGWGSDDPSLMQEGHGLNIDPDGNYAMWSNLNNHSVQVLRLADNKIITDPIYDESVYTPHGLFPNPSGTMAVTPNYAYGNQTATLWTLEDGIPSFSKTVEMNSDEIHGAWPHMAEWINDEQFLLASGHETIDPPINTYEAGLWLCNTTDEQCQSLIDETTLDTPEAGVLKGVSDVVWKSNGDKIRMYVGEGNFLQKDPHGGPVAGYISIWDFDPNSGQPAQYIDRLSAGEKGMPEAFRDVHGMCRTSDHAYTMSFASDFLIEMDLDTDEISNVYDREDGLIVPHGVACSG